MKVLLIVPAYNEAENLPTVIREIQTYSKKQTTFQLEYIVINDGSTDQTQDVCKTNQIKAIHLSQNLGIGGAVQTGYLYAFEQGYDIAVQYDGDGQHDIASLEALLTPLFEEKADFVVGSRFLNQSNAFRSTAVRRIGIRYLAGMIRLLSRESVTDPTSGFRAANRRVISYFSKNYPVDYPEPESIMLLSKLGFRMAEVPVCMRGRLGGVSSIRVWRSFYYMFKVSLAVVFASFIGSAEEVL